MDTLSAVEHMERLFGRVRVHDAEKVAKIRRMLAESADLEGIFAALAAPKAG
jgi:BioD-like phosphotransacetylase family protein